MEESLLTKEQIILFNRMISKAFEEVRNLISVGLSEQAFALADSFHNIPASLFDKNFSWERTRMFVESYQKKYPRNIKNNCIIGSYHDYKTLLDEIESKIK